MKSNSKEYILSITWSTCMWSIIDLYPTRLLWGTFLKLRTLPPLHLQTSGYEGCCLERGAVYGMWYHAHDCRSDAHPPIVFALASVDLHNSLYNTAKQAEPQLYRLVLYKLIKNGKYIRWTLLPILSDIKTSPIKPSMTPYNGHVVVLLLGLHLVGAYFL